MEMEKLVATGKEVFINNYRQLPIVFEEGKGNSLIDKEGKEYLDFVAGIAVNALGYKNTKLNEALKAQIDKFTHCSNLYYNEPAIEAAQKLIKASGLDKVFFCNSGAEANEAAIKLARKYSKEKFGQEKYEIISMKNSFHGRTIATITATGQEKYQKNLSPLLPGVKYCEYNNIEQIENTISDKTCAVLIEIIQGEGGIVSIEKDYLIKLRALCDKHNVVLIFDEVQTGIGRTGEIFAYQLYDIKPDILSLAKGLGAGIPIGAIVANDKVAMGFEPGDHASTFGGNPLACTAANVVLSELLEGGLLAHIKEMGEYLKNKLAELMNKKDVIVDIRGTGLIQGIALEGISIIEVLTKCMENGLLLVGAGSNVIRFVPPLTITKEEIDKAIDILDKSLL